MSVVDFNTTTLCMFSQHSYQVWQNLVPHKHPLIFNPSHINNSYIANIQEISRKSSFSSTSVNVYYNALKMLNKQSTMV